MTDAYRATSELPVDERRRHPRARGDHPLTIALADGPREVRLRDVSVSGVCFYSDAPIPEMTALGIQLELPNDGSPGERIEAGGAVVRCQRISPHMEHYEVAVFLHDATETTRRKIAKYVDRIGGR